MISGTRLMAAAVALAAIVVLGAAACSSSSSTADPTPVTTFLITPSNLAAATMPAASPTAAVSATAVATAAATSAATPAASPAATSAATAAATSGGSGTKIILIAQNLVFDKTTLTAPAGAITIELENKDPGQPHNVHVFKGTNVTGTDEGSTTLNVGPTTDTLNLTLDKGSYYYQCDVHPTTMFGTLTVN